MMQKPKKCPDGSVGVVFKKNDKYLMFWRLKKPQGWAGVAGHLDGDEPLVAGPKESLEEVGVKIDTKRLRLIFKGSIYPNPCKRGDYNTHDWEVYEYELTEDDDEPKICEPDHHKDLGWFTKSEIKEMFSGGKYDPAWRYIFSKLGVI